MILMDTSAIFALTDEADDDYQTAKNLFAKVVEEQGELLVHNYIITESAALIQRRLGLSQAKKVLKEIERFHAIWVDEILHKEAVNYFNKHATRNLSFVDCVSFVVMHQQGITTALAFDEDFEKAGFQLYS